MTALLVVAAPAWAADSGSQDRYRLCSPNSGEHFYTANVNEHDSLVAGGWHAGGIGWYALEAGRPDGTKADIVYYTAHGKRYHQSRTCHVIVNRSVSLCTVAEAQRRGLTPCHDCC